MSKIIYQKGCLVAAFARCEVDVIAHQANCQRTMGSGVAKAIREAYPEAYTADFAAPGAPRERLGTFSMALISRPDMDNLCFSRLGVIYNLYGQLYYGYDPMKQYTNYDMLDSAMGSMAEQVPAGVWIGMPKLGCGLAGGSWDVVENLIKQNFINHNVVVYEL